MECSQNLGVGHRHCISQTPTVLCFARKSEVAISGRGNSPDAQHIACLVFDQRTQEVSVHDVSVHFAGLRNRANGSNTVNEHSSRSHSVLTLNIDSEIYDEEDDKLCMTRHGKLAFVDLAGARLLSIRVRTNEPPLPKKYFDTAYLTGTNSLLSTN